MKVTIITCTFNSAATLSWNLESVARQSYPDIEHIIIDNVSNDATIAMASSYTHIKKIISEPDKGIYDGMNKGISLATGDIIGILNSDDYLAGPETIADIVNQFKKEKCEAVYGNLVYVHGSNPEMIQRVWVAGGFNKELFYKGWMLPHPTFYVKKQVYEKYGVFNPRLRYSADYELMLRLLLKYQIKVSVMRKVLVYMRSGGSTNKNILARLKVNQEDRAAWKSVQLSPNWYTLYLKPLRKSWQFISHKFSVKWLVHIPPSHKKESYINKSVPHARIVFLPAIKKSNELV